METSSELAKRLRGTRDEAAELLRKSTGAVRLKRRIERHIRGENSVEIVAALPALAPYSAGTFQERARLTLQTARRVFPLIAQVAQKTGISPSTPVDVAEFQVDGQDRIDPARLKVLLDNAGSDKASKHDYHHLYAQVLGDVAKVTTVVEIGLGTNNPDVVSSMGLHGSPGASLRAFRDYLPSAQVYGADIDRRVLFSEERIATCFIDQTDATSFAELDALVGTEIDLIIDDGLHSPDANLQVLLFALSRLRTGGWVVIEDISPDAEPLWQVVDLLLRDQYETAIVSANGALMYALRRVT